ncbi:glycosyltransferase involved in cell wall biosynthesis [Altererythrobacter atlanticus]|uniref:Glycosyl transferase family 2 n=1 Tax=Croceibacterium atlanticum TaxID=1267766 RepID=A0A0F7KLF8_9SPHN|nr:glycosyltransferase family A protein [Croceibacterium atlanticum]AKH41368.1 Glycosyl transferase family 2 [Croceibacterium atlanticum]MBB5734117.1 glycosyltransferase involved in cell wall biosynthesis [Croceibacterium atlanticum]
MNRRIFLSTPLRNEIDNIDRLFASVAGQDHPITLWVIVENGSTDGSREELARRTAPSNVERLIVLNENTETGAYALGAKYARIVNRGFEEILARIELGEEDLIGILDADSFPDPGYYTTLARAFDNNQRLGIASGRSVDEGDGRASLHAVDWVRGSCRLWRGRCMIQSGYIIGPSADTLSLARAELDGWQAHVIDKAVFRAREVGTRSKQRYYGSSAYFRGNTAIYALIRGAKFARHGRLGAAKEYLKGYFGARHNRQPRLENPDLRAYFQGYVLRKVKRRLGWK